MLLLYPNRLTAMSPSNMPAISLNVMTDGEYIIVAVDRQTKAILAASSSYDCTEATLRIDLQLIDLGFEIYAPESY